MATVLCVATGLRIFGLSSTWLWYDEVFGAAFATLNPFEITVASLRFDIHPPAWSYQLATWGLAGNGDLWLLLNSVAWSVSGVFSLYWTTNRLYGKRTALLAAALFALLPVAVAYAQFLRMYAMLMTLVIWAWYLQTRLVSSSATRLTASASLLCGIVIAYTHGVGLLINLYVAFYGLLAVVLADSSCLRSPLKLMPARWWWTHIAIGIASLGALPYAVVKRVAHTAKPNFANLVRTMEEYWFGVGVEHTAASAAIAIALIALVAVAAAVSIRARATILAFVLVPIVGTAAVSFTLKPIWHLHALLFTVPFAALSIAILTDKWLSTKRIWSQSAAIVLSAAFLTATAFCSLHWLTTYKKETNYPAAVTTIRQWTEPGDVIAVAEPPHYWGVARYFIGPDWGSPLDVQPFEFPDDRWGKTLAALGPQWRKRLALEPSRRHLDHDDRTLVIGLNVDKFLEQDGNEQGVPEHVVVVRETVDEPHAIAGYELTNREAHDRVELLLFERVSTRRLANNLKALGNRLFPSAVYASQTTQTND